MKRKPMTHTTIYLLLNVLFRMCIQKANISIHLLSLGEHIHLCLSKHQCTWSEIKCYQGTLEWFIETYLLSYYKFLYQLFLLFFYFLPLKNIWYYTIFSHMWSIFSWYSVCNKDTQSTPIASKLFRTTRTAVKKDRLNPENW